MDNKDFDITLLFKEYVLLYKCKRSKGNLLPYEEAKNLFKKGLINTENLELNRNQFPKPSTYHLTDKGNRFLAYKLRKILKEWLLSTIAIVISIISLIVSILK